jgi:AmiR/NasT family two-component response regulator
MLRSRGRRRTRSMRHLASSRALAKAMRSRATIEQAKGILIGRLGCSPDQAFQLLVAQSQHENRKLRAVAEELVTRNIKGRADGDGQRDGERTPAVPTRRNAVAPHA